MAEKAENELDWKLKMKRFPDVEGVSIFEKELEGLLNKHSQENGSDTPDFILAQYLTGCLEVFNNTVRRRSDWYKRDGFVYYTLQE